MSPFMADQKSGYKEMLLFQGRENFISMLRKHVEIHATINHHRIMQTKYPTIINHGVLSPQDYKEIILTAKVKYVYFLVILNIVNKNE